MLFTRRHIMYRVLILVLPSTTLSCCANPRREAARQEPATLKSVSSPTVECPRLPAAQPTQSLDAAPATSGRIELGPGIFSQSQGGLLTIEGATDVLFDSGDSTIKYAAREAIKKIADRINLRHAGQAVHIDGYADASPIRSNPPKGGLHRLSQARADAVKAKLVEHGVAAHLIFAKGHGSTKPKATLAASRRVEISVGVH